MLLHLKTQMEFSKAFVLVLSDHYSAKMQDFFFFLQKVILFFATLYFAWMPL